MLHDVYYHTISCMCEGHVYFFDRGTLIDYTLVLSLFLFLCTAD